MQKYKMATFEPTHEDLTGADLSGSSGDINRTYVLPDNTVLEHLQIIVSERILQNDVNFTFDENTFTATFLFEIDDDFPITLDYLIEG